MDTFLVEGILHTPVEPDTLLPTVKQGDHHFLQPLDLKAFKQQCYVAQRAFGRFIGIRGEWPMNYRVAWFQSKNGGRLAKIMVSLYVPVMAAYEMQQSDCTEFDEDGIPVNWHPMQQLTDTSLTHYFQEHFTILPPTQLQTPLVFEQKAVKLDNGKKSSHYVLRNTNTLSPQSVDEIRRYGLRTVEDVLFGDFP